MLASNLRAISQVVLLRNICRSNSTVESDIDNNKKITKSIDKNLDETEKNRENKNDLKSQKINRFLKVDKSNISSNSFYSLLRHSKFVQLGDFNGRIVIGKIFHKMADDLYIDFGLKFNAVCKAPQIQNEKYQIGTKVLVRLHDPELSERFLGSNKDLTLLEADATLLGLYHQRPIVPRNTRISKEHNKSVENVKTVA